MIIFLFLIFILYFLKFIYIINLFTILSFRPVISIAAFVGQCLICDRIGYSISNPGKQIAFCHVDIKCMAFDSRFLLQAFILVFIQKTNYLPTSREKE